jgi:integrase
MTRSATLLLCLALAAIAQSQPAPEPGSQTRSLVGGSVLSLRVHEPGTVYICYKNEHGRIIRENTHQTNVNAADLMLAQFDKKRAREITPDGVRAFLADLREEGLAASSIKQCRTILCSVFNYAIRFEKYDKNPVSVVSREKEPPGLDRFPEPEEIVAMIRVCEEKGDLELKAFLVLAPTTGMRKGEILSRKWSDIDLDSGNPLSGQAQPPVPR